MGRQWAQAGAGGGDSSCLLHPGWSQGSKRDESAVWAGQPGLAPPPPLSLAGQSACPWVPQCREGRAASSWPGGQAVLAPPAEDVLESYENPPPIVLPSEGFQVDLEADGLDDSIYQHLLYVRHFLWGLRSKPSPSGGPPQPEGLEVPLTAGWIQRLAAGPGEERE